MSESSVTLFFEKAAGDPVLRGKLDEAWLQWAGRVAALSMEAGVPFTTDDLLRAQSSGGELSDDLLDRVAGGGAGGRDFGWVHRPYNPNGGFGGY